MVTKCVRLACRELNLFNFMSCGNKLHRDSYLLNPLLNGQRGCVCLLMNAFSEVRNYPL